MIDMHSHILPNIDDGSNSIEETYKLIQEAKDAGFDAIITTSHYMEDNFEVAEQERIKIIDHIYENLKTEDIKLYIGNEIYFSDNIEKLLATNKASTINNTSYVLFEMPMNTKPINLYDVVFKMLQHKLIPILAHPERYTYVHENPSLICDLIDKGVLMQANYGSIIGQYGTNAQIIVKKFLKNNMIHFLGTDVHRQNTIYTKMSVILAILKELIGEEKLEVLTSTNPKLVLENKEIDNISKPPDKIEINLIEKLVMKFKRA